MAKGRKPAKKPKAGAGTPASGPLADAKSRLDGVIGKSRVHLYKPLMIAEILRRERLDGNINLARLEDYRLPGRRWLREVCERLRIPERDHNAGYFDQLYTDAVLPPRALFELGRANRAASGSVEAYIFREVADRFAKVFVIRRRLTETGFDLRSFLDGFETDEGLRRSVDKVYEIVVHALFTAVMLHLGATITVGVRNADPEVLADFEDLTRMVLGVDRRTTEIAQAPRLYRTGVANARDGGLDMWANFGPAVQVKHVTLKLDLVERICAELKADRIIIVCKTEEQPVIEAVAAQTFGDRVRGIINEGHLIRWYGIALGPKHRNRIGERLLETLRAEYDDEFPVSESAVDELMKERGYDKIGPAAGWMA